MFMSPIVAAQLGPTGPAPVSLNHILRAVRTHLGMEVGFISEFRGGRRVFRHVESAEGKQCIEVGASDPLEQSYCHWIAEGKLPQLIRDPKDHPFTANFAATESLPVGAHLSVPIRLREGQVYGTFCCFSFEPDRSLTDRDMATMEAFAQLAAEQIQQTMDDGRERDAKVARVKTILRERSLQMVFQPAIRTDAPCIEFLEALARFTTKPYQSPDRWFAAAGEVGLREELELLAIGQALEDGFARMPERMALSINASPDVILSHSFAAALEGAPLKRIIVEITEHDAVSRYSALIDALAPLRSAGLRVAIDDMGAGFSSLRHILLLKPDIIKLDMALSQGIDRDPARRSLASALVAFSRETGSQLVAEGVETESELHTLRNLGVKVVQGYLFGQPSAELPEMDLVRFAFENRATSN
jgi:EAL domain-containing protein (putative c-di-GMP-specific phosphodiesterase class I)